MTKKTIALAALFGLAVLIPLAAPATARAAVISQKEIHVAPGETSEAILSFGGNVLVEGQVKGDVVVIGGSITIAGDIDQSVVGIGSHVIVKSTARIAKDLAALGGTLEKEPGCSIGGDTTYFQTGELGDRLFRHGQLFRDVFSLSLLPIILAVKLVMVVLWLIVAVIGAALFPKPIVFAAGEIRKHFWPAFGIGLLAILIFSIAVFIAALLSIILVGLPIVLALTVAGFIVKIFGRLAVFYLLGASALGGFRDRKVTVMGASLLGWVIFSLAGFVPVLGFFFTLVMNAVGWGIAIRTKFGSRENWFVKSTPAPGC